MAEFLPLDSQNWITCGNALRLDWLSICPPTGTGVRVQADDLFGTPLDQAEIDFENEGGETYICGNPPYLGSKWQDDQQKSDLAAVFDARIDGWKSLDYVAGWLMKAASYGATTPTVSAFVATNSICQGQQVPILWPAIFSTGHEIHFAHSSFKWSNLASNKAGVTVVIIGLGRLTPKLKTLFSLDSEGATIVREATHINAYLIAGEDVIVAPRQQPARGLPAMVRGNSPTDGGHLLLEREEVDQLALSKEQVSKFIKPFVGSREMIAGQRRYCIWIDDSCVASAMEIPTIASRIGHVREFRTASKKAATVRAADWPHRFDERKSISEVPIIMVPVVSSENRQYLPVDVLPPGTVPSNKVFTINGVELWPMSIVCSRLNLVWVSAVCARMRTDFSYTNTLGWNTFPSSILTDQNKRDLTRCAEDILLAREAHFPATIADLYEPDAMPDDLRAAHDRNDEVLERIYIGRRFRNDTERLEKLFELYTKMTTKGKAA